MPTAPPPPGRLTSATDTGTSFSSVMILWMIARHEIGAAADRERDDELDVPRRLPVALRGGMARCPGNGRGGEAGDKRPAQNRHGVLPG